MTNASSEPSSHPAAVARIASFSRLERALVAALLGLGALTFLPAIGTPFLLDDYMHTAMIEGTFCAPRGPFDLYDFVGDRDRHVLLDRGQLPWWTHPELKIRFFRPLSSALRWSEQRLFGARPLLFHIHSFAWWAAAVLAARALFRSLLRPRAALIAVVVFALGSWHAVPIAWLANREVLLSITFGGLGLAAYARWLDARRGRDAALATTLFSLALLAGEYGLCLGGYILAIELFRRKTPLFARFSGLLPFAVPALVYLAARGALGYGTNASEFYYDPLREPLSYLQAAPERLATLLVEEWLTLGSNVWGTTEPRAVVVACLVVLVVVVFSPLRRAIGALEDERKRTAKWLLAGSFLSLAPVLAVVPGPRLLGLSALGMAALLGVFFDHAWFDGDARDGAPQANATGPKPRRQFTGFAATVLGFCHFVHGPVSTCLWSAELRRSTIGYAASAAALSRHIGDVATSEVIMVRGLGGMIFGPFALDPRGISPARYRILAHTGHLLVLRRDARTIELVTAATQGIYATGPGNLFRSSKSPLLAGDTIALRGMTVQVLETSPHGPRRVRVTFDRDLDDAPFVLAEEGFDGFRTVVLPPAGFGAPFDP